MLCLHTDYEGGSDMFLRIVLLPPDQRRDTPKALPFIAKAVSTSDPDRIRHFVYYGKARSTYEENFLKSLSKEFLTRKAFYSCLL
jgi:hypothetical protein